MIDHRAQDKEALNSGESRVECCWIIVFGVADSVLPRGPVMLPLRVTDECEDAIGRDALLETSDGQPSTPTCHPDQFDHLLRCIHALKRTLSRPYEPENIFQRSRLAIKNTGAGARK